MATIASSSSSCCIKTTIPSPEGFLHILTIGKKRFKGIQAQLIVEEYKEKLKHYCSVDDVQIKSNPKYTSDVMAQIKGEDNIIIQHIRSEDWASPLNLHMLTKTFFYYYYYYYYYFGVFPYWVFVKIEPLAKLEGTQRCKVVVLEERGQYIGFEQMAELVGDAWKTV
ncbi:putative RNA methyltransferase [Cinnamomum micranthum f. kanehirae]|uniref:Putative RNA methyltransferase n=1 Tax=Cinnamomum micranthum f. kanehirae TaxID=337451 RepID=A0A443Q3W2_9MAGN|nr:putative RNA methyltransferase [Cinnamomum micranthum f. kanehirae]